MPNKQKLITAEKADLVRRCQAGEIGGSEGGGEARVAAETVRGWIARYEREGVEGFIPQKKNRVNLGKTLNLGN